MNFYKLKDIETGQDTYVNPKMIEYYMYVNDHVQIETSSMYMRVSLEEFEYMMILEGIEEYWNTHHTTA